MFGRSIEIAGVAGQPEHNTAILPGADTAGPA
jgi:hypothetical protein